MVAIVSSFPESCLLIARFLLLGARAWVLNGGECGMRLPVLEDLYPGRAEDKEKTTKRRFRLLGLSRLLNGNEGV